MSASRRMFCASSVPAILLLADALASAQAVPSQKLGSFAKPFEAMVPQEHGSSSFRPICDGVVAAGMHVEVHETELNPGAEPHPPHRHKHEEFLLLMKGRLEITIDGQSSTLTPGSVGFWQSMALHHARNIGHDVAQYFIVSVGTDA